MVDDMMMIYEYYITIYNSKSVQWPTGMKMFLITLSKLLSLSWSVAHICIVVQGHSLLFCPYSGSVL